MPSGRISQRSERDRKCFSCMYKFGVPSDKIAEVFDFKNAHAVNKFASYYKIKRPDWYIKIARRLASNSKNNKSHRVSLGGLNG